MNQFQQLLKVNQSRNKKEKYLNKIILRKRIKHLKL